MSHNGRSLPFWRATIVICLALVVSGVAPESEISRAAPVEQYIYFIQVGTPAAIPNFVDVVAGCNWSGIGGQVFTQAGAPVIGLRVKISGTFDGRQILQYVTTGSSQRFGPGGFDYKLADRPIASQSLRLQLLDSAGVRQSPPFNLRTFGTCQQNLLVINLTPISIENVIYLPQIPRP